MAITRYSPSDIVVEMLIQAGQLSRQSATGQTSGSWPGFAGGEPDSPDNTVTIYDTTGSWNIREFVGSKNIGPSGLQIRVRANTHRVAWNKAQELYEYLEQVYNRGVSIGTSPDSDYAVIGSFCQFGDILSIGKESPQSKRSIVTLNLQVDFNQS